MLEKLYKKEVWFAVGFILIYVIGNSLLEGISNDVGYEMIFSIPFNVILLIILFAFVVKKGLLEYYGFCRVKTSCRNLLFYIPLIIVSTVNIWMGVCLKKDVVGSIVYFLAMLITGVVEEFLFRGLLFQAMSKKSVRAAVILTSILFGVGHIVNLFNDSGMDRVETVCQIFYAVAIGFLLAAVLYVGKSIIPCICAHSVLNALSTFSNDAAFENIQIPVSIALCVIAGGSALTIYFLNKKKS